MSLKSLEARKLATASVVALSVLGVTASAAQADIEKNLEYTCKYPLVDKKPLSINVKSNIPLFAKINEQQPAFVVNAIATAKDGTSEAIDTLDAYKLSGVSEARASLVFPSGFVQGNLKVPLTVDPYIRAPNAPIPDPLVLTANGKTPSVNLDELGKTDIRLDKISLNLSAFYQDGTPINVKKLLTDFDGNPVVDSDGNVNTFDVYCKLNADQSPIIATICVNATGLADDSCGGGPLPNVPPSKVAGVTAGTATETTIPLTWTPATDTDGTIKAYNVYVNGAATPAKTVTTGTSTTLDGLTGDTTYSITVEAVDNKDAKGEKSAAVSAKTAPKPVVPNVPPSKVVGVTAGTTTETTIPVSWTAATDSDGTIKAYNVYVNGAATPAKTVTTGTSTTLDGLTAETTYSITVEAVDNKDAKGTKSDAVSAKTAPKPVVPNVPPSKVVGVTAGTATDTTIPLSWTAATDSDGTIKAYNVYVNGAATPAKTVTQTSTTLDGLTAETTYSITVEAVDNKDAKGEKSAAVSAKTAPKPVVPNVAPSKVVGVTAGTATETTIPLSWTAATDTDGTIKAYNVYVNGAAAPAKTVTTGTSTTLDGLTADTTYSITVEAVDNKDAKGAKSDAVSAKTAPKPVVPNVAPSKVVGVTAGTTTETTIPVSWTAATDSDGTIKAYNVYVNGAATPAKTVTTGTSTTLDGLTGDTTYSITVEAVDNKDAKGAKSDAVSAKTAPKPVVPNVAPSKVVGVKAGTTTETTIPLSWTAATDSDGTIKAYNVYVNGAATPAKTVTTTSATLDGLTADTTYKVTVEAVDNKDAKGAKSDELSAKTATKPVPGNKAPVVKSIIGKTAFAKIGGIAIVQGTNFTGIKSVTVGGKSAATASLGNGLLLVILPPLAKGSYPLVVTNADGASATTTSTTIKYISLF